MLGDMSSVEFTQSTPVLKCGAYFLWQDFYVDKLGLSAS